MVSGATKVKLRNSGSSSASGTFMKYCGSACRGLAYLVELEGRGQPGVEPQGVAGGLADLFAAGSGEQRRGEPEGVLGVGAPLLDQVDAGQDVPPLILAAKLDLAAEVLVQMPEVVRLE